MGRSSSQDRFPVRNSLRTGISVDYGQTMKSASGKMVRLRRTAPEGGGTQQLGELKLNQLEEVCEEGRQEVRFRTNEHGHDLMI
jgi:hypothetical protein